MIYTIDTERGDYSPIFSCGLGDTRTDEYTFTKNGQPITFINPIIEFNAIKKDGNTVHQVEDITYANGKVKIKYDKQCSTYRGVVEAEFLIVDEERTTTARFFFYVRDTIAEGIIGSITDEYLKEAYQELEAENIKLNITLNENEVARSTAEQERKADELTRKSDEVNRVAAETGRAEAEVNREQRLVEAETKVDGFSASLAEKAKQIDLEVERKRIDSFTSLSQGSTTGDAELIDGRIGADGITYNNIGTANRTQLKSKLEKFEFELSNKNSIIPYNISSWVVGSLTGNTEIESNIRLRSIPIQINLTESKTYNLEFYSDYFDICVIGLYASGSVASNSDYINSNKSITLKNGTTTVRFLLRYRKNNGKVLTVEEIQHLKVIMYLEEKTTKKRFEQIEVDNGIIKKDVAKLKADIVGVTNELAKIKVMSYNMGMFGYGTQQGIVNSELETRLTRWRRFLGKANADLMCTQEQRETLDRDNTVLIDENLLSAVYPCRFKYTGGHPTWSGVAINSKYVLTDSQEFYLSETESDVKAKRRCVKSYMHVNGVKIRVISCHLSPAVTLTDPSKAVEVRKSQMLELLDIVKNEEYFIICGDFNVETGIEEYLTFSQNDSKLANAGYFGAIRTYNYAMDYTDSADPTQDRFLDNIVCSNNIRIDNFEALDWAFDMCTSDHLPIVAELTLTK